MKNKKPPGPRIILWDLEVLPDLPEALKFWTQLSNYPGQTLKASVTSICCFGWKVLGEKKTHCINAWDFKGWKKDVNDDKELVAEARKILASADLHVFHNGKRFDAKHFQTRLALHKFNNPKDDRFDFLHRIPSIDTCAESKKNLLMFNNRLATLSEALTNQPKMEHEGWELWVKTHGRDPKAMKTMEAYCKQDVRALEELYLGLRPLMKGIPNYNIWTDPALGQSCPNCGNPVMKKNGTRVHLSGVYQMYKCVNCGTYAQSKLKTLAKPFKTL